MTSIQLAEKFRVHVRTISRWKKQGLLVDGHLKQRPSPAWNKGKALSKEHKEAVSKGMMGKQNTLGRVYGPSFREGIRARQTGRKHTEEARQKMRANGGGYRQGGGRGKKGWVRGIWCDSSWEAAFVVWHLDKGIPIKRSVVRYPYVWRGAKRLYQPDFDVNGVTYEIKGYVTEQTEAKRALTPHVVVLQKEHIIPFLVYAETTYGKEFTKRIYTEPRQI